MNYFADPHDLKVMTAVMRQVLEIMAGTSPGHRVISSTRRITAVITFQIVARSAK